MEMHRDNTLIWPGKCLISLTT